MIQRHLELFIFLNKWKCDILFDRRNERIWTNFRLDKQIIKFLHCEFYYASLLSSGCGPRLSKFLENHDKISKLSCFIHKYLRYRPRDAVVYRLINHAGCWYNTRRIRKSRAAVFFPHPKWFICL